MCHFHIYDKTNYLRLVAVLKKMGRCYRGKNMAGTERQKYGQNIRDMPSVYLDYLPPLSWLSDAYLPIIFILKSLYDLPKVWN